MGETWTSVCITICISNGTPGCWGTRFDFISTILVLSFYIFHLYFFKLLASSESMRSNMKQLHVCLMDDMYVNEAVACLING